MENKKKFVNKITPRNVDFAKWYTDIVKKAGLIDYSSVRGCMVICPYGYAIWENIQKILDKKFKELGHENVSMPLFIPESLLQKEKEHIKGFAPEVAWVTHGGETKLAERLCVRPTSEVLFCEHFARIVQSWRDLPKLYNQWCNVVRWEKSSRPFLRSIEFHWQEGHTIHETPEEAKFETRQMLDVYADFCENELAIPVIKGQKTELEKFAGAKTTYTIESMMYDGKALQSGTSHYFGNHFLKPFNVVFQNRENKEETPYQTSWGLSTRIIGGIIMTHGDDDGLILPPAIAPIQVVIIPIAVGDNNVMEKAADIFNKLKQICRVKLDASEQTAGWKFAEYEMKGVPIRLEIGPKDIEKNQCVLVRRDNREKIFVDLNNLNKTISELLNNISENMFEIALKFRDSMISTAKNFEEFKLHSSKNGFIKVMWCGENFCEEKIKNELGLTSRCIPFEQEFFSENCVCCRKKAKHMIYFGKSY